MKNKHSNEARKREPYSRPLLKSFGLVGVITQAGTTGMAEMGMGGMGMGGMGGGGGMGAGMQRA